MGYEPTLIAPWKSGLSQYYKPFLIGNDAFTELENCYSWRGRIRKREGSSKIGRVPVWATIGSISDTTPPVVTSVAHGLLTDDMVFLEDVATTNGTITNIATGLTTVITCVGAPGVSPGQTIVVYGQSGVTTADGLDFNGQIFIVSTVVGNDITLIVETEGTWTAGGVVYLGALDRMTFKITVLTANTFSLQAINFPNGNIVAAGTAVSGNIWLPIVGTRIFLLVSTGNEQLIVFTPKQAFLYNTSTFVFDDISFDTTSTAILWSGTRDSLVYTSNYASVMWATNNVFNTVDQPVGIRYFNGSSTAGWVDFQPLISGATTYLNSALIILPYKGRLVALNTTEGTNAAAPGQTNTRYFQRARWCQLGTPFVNNPATGFNADAAAWRSDIPGRGGFNDADTSERIVSAEIIQDTLIVSFQFSTWRLRYTGNEILPFIWERINTQYGSGATFASIPFDEGKADISTRGIIMSSFNDTQRIDMIIPDFVNNFATGSIGEGINRIYGVRDFQKRLVYWTYPTQDPATGEQAGTPDRILCMNYEDKTWSTFNQGFVCLGNYKQTTDNIWSTWTTPWQSDFSTWETPLTQLNTILIVAGAKDGYVWHLMNSDIATDDGENFDFVITTNWINPYFDKGSRCRLQYYDLYTTATSFGKVTVENFTDDNDSDAWLVKAVDTNDNQVSSNPNADVKYVRVFLGMIARNHQISISLSDAQLEDAQIGASDFELQGIIFYTREAGRIKQ